MSVHSIAEVYTSLARLPVQPRIHPLEAVRIVPTTFWRILRSCLSAVEDYMEALNAVGNGGWSGAKIYDALLLRCAASCTVERIYTFNLRDFKQLAPASLQGIICAPCLRPRFQPNCELLRVFAFSTLPMNGALCR
jgi:hypothetical protein